MKKKLVISFLILALLQSCEDEIFSPIPYAPVKLTLDLNFEDNQLNSLYACKTYTRKQLDTNLLGYGGILVVNGFGPNVVNLFAYDLACPVETNRDIKIVPDDLGRAACPQCKAIYNIANGNGSPESGTRYFLKAYSVSSYGNNRYGVNN